MVTEQMVQDLDGESLDGWLSLRRGWKVQDGRLVKAFRFGSFRDAIIFVNRLATIADTLDHHPDIDIRYRVVAVSLWTHSAGGLTDKDIGLAEAIDHATSHR